MSAAGSSGGAGRSSVLFVLLDHRPAPEVELLLDWWRALGVRDEDLLIAHGGPAAHRVGLRFDNVVAVDDPRLATKDPQRERQSYRAVWLAAARWVAPRPHTHLYMAEYDHLPLAGDLAARLLDRMHAERADVLAHALERVDGTSYANALYHERDPRLDRFLRAVSRRPAPVAVFSMLGTGSCWRREALETVAAVEEPCPIYLELWLPTVAHHLGFRIRPYAPDQDRWARHTGDFTPCIQRAHAEGAWTLHPVKRMPTPWGFGFAGGPSRGRMKSDMPTRPSFP